MPVRFRFRPLTWAGPSTPPEDRRGRGAFRATYPATLALLAREIEALGAGEAVIEANFALTDIRLDGLPRANARHLGHPGVRVAFTGQHGPLIYQTDLHADWRHNLRAITLGLEALRAVDRYGITSHGEQYRGWTAIEAAPGDTDLDRAARRLGDLAGWTTPPDWADPAVLDVAYRAAARRCHPDTGGSKDLFQELQRVMAVLRGT